MIKFILLLSFIFASCQPQEEENGKVPTGTKNIHSESQTVFKGSVSATSISSLNTQDQTGSDDEFTKYIEYSPAAAQSEVHYSFKVQPKQIDPNIDFKLALNFKGSPVSYDQWVFEYFNSQTNQWTRAGDNTQAKDWKWSFFYFNLAKMNQVFNSEGLAKIKVRTVTGKDQINLDLLVLNHAGSLVDPDPVPDPNDPPAGSWWKPVLGQKWDIQYVGTINLQSDIKIYNIDLFDTADTYITQLHSQGKKVICYFSAGSFEDWRPDAADFTAPVLGKDMDGWPGEKWLDVRRLDILRPIMKKRMQMAKTKGCDGVDPDNVDGFNNDTGFPLTYNDQLNFNKMMVAEAHALGLAIGLKNNLEQIKDLVGLYDFAVNESCFDWDECDMLTPFVNQGKPVFGIQYNKTSSTFCPMAKNLKLDFIKKKRELDGWAEYCWKI
jgi:hypothetical protein